MSLSQVAIVLLAFILVGMALRRRPFRRELILAALFAVPVLLVLSLTAASILHFPGAAFTGNRLYIERLLLGLLTSTIAVGAYILSARRLTTPIPHPERRQLVFFLWVPIGALCLAAANVLTLPQAAGVAILATAISTVRYRRIWWEVGYAILGGATLAFVIGLVAGPGIAGTGTSYWVTTVTGLTVLGIPVEALATLAAWGALFGPGYVGLRAVYERQLQYSLVVASPPPRYRLKQLTVSFAVLVIFISIDWGVRQTLLTPQVLGVATEAHLGLTESITIRFDRPVRRPSLLPEIEPAVPGSWEYGDLRYGNRFAQSLTFTPDRSFQPGQAYTVRVAGVRTILGRTATEVVRTYQTAGLAQVVSSSIADSATDVSACTPVTLALDSGDIEAASFHFQFEPETSITETWAADRRSITLAPQPCFAQGIAYVLTATRSLTIHREDAGREVVYQSEPEIVWSSRFTTKQPPGLADYTPKGSTVHVDVPAATLTFSQAMATAAPSMVQVDPPFPAGEWQWESPLVLSYRLQAPLQYATTYTITLPVGLADANGGSTTEPITARFSTIGPVRVSSLYPANGANGIVATTAFSVQFNQEVTHASAEAAVLVEPAVTGSFAWQGSTLHFQPTQPLAKDETYVLTVRSGVQAVYGQPSVTSVSSRFTTEESVTLLSVPYDRQDAALSCEAAALKMALSYRGLNVSEGEIMAHIGYDPTVRSGGIDGIWGDPDAAFVGSLTGSQNSTGYGVHASPILRTARVYRSATLLSGASITTLTEQIALGNPVVVWGTLGNARPDRWYTPNGKLISTWVGEHARTVIGFTGKPSNPRQIILNDPIVGRISWSTAQFLANWGRFGNVGVAIY